MRISPEPPASSRRLLRVRGSLRPPLTFGTEDVAIAACFVPKETLAGDAFDYGVDARRAQVAVFDAMGHGLGAGLLATAQLKV